MLGIKRGRHEGADVPKEPHIVMHEDDPVVKRYPTIFTRRNLSILKSIFVAALIAQLIVQQFQIESYLGNRRKAVFKNNQEIACFIVRNHPNSDGQDYADLRDKYDCPAYDPANVRRPSPSRITVTPGAKPSSSRSAPPRSAGPGQPTSGIFGPNPAQSSARRTPGAAPSGPVATRTAANRPGSTSTVTRHVTATPRPAGRSIRTVTRTSVPPAPTPGVLGGLLCTPLNLPLGIGC